jgi:DNA-directed RNA polymerase specialized sigma24 family protein
MSAHESEMPADRAGGVAGEPGRGLPNEGAPAGGARDLDEAAGVQDVHDAGGPIAQGTVRAADGVLELEHDDDDDPGLDVEPARRAYQGDEWPVLSFDIGLLADAETDPERHEAEWRRVYEHFDPYLRYYFEDVMRYRDSDEIVAAVWRKALRKIGSLDVPENAWWWLIRIGRNYFIDQRRQEGRRLRNDRTGLDRMTEDTPEDWRDRILDEIAREKTFGDRIDLRAFRVAFAALKDSDQEFAYLLQSEELSHEQLVERLKLKSVEASRQRWRWIKKKLREALGVQ